MKILIFLLIALNSFSQQDKLIHFSAGYGCATIVTGLTDKHAVLCGIGLTCVIGASKEIYDIKHGTPDVKDFISTAIGGVVGSALRTC